MCSVPVVTFSLIPLICNQSAMLEEQKSVMEHCTAERRRLDAEWASFHIAEKQRQEQVEKVSSLLEKRESAIIALANVSLFTFVTLFAILRPFGQICSDRLDCLCVHMCCDVGTS